ncbi:alpha/beta fold hydrolase [Halosegnis marinus]|uniref:Alpha/beta fold hydrolase n=1 Tax=Halosegnis marinus TaxID=3034023 RepID=A0ABD5ZMS9_9EURY|nr:alpha/beta hydrolase [Halosegnis sp. DT85]
MDSRTVAGGGGVDIRVDAYGPADARPVLMLHGYSQCRLAWRGQYRSSLADDYRLLCVDLRGHGASDKPRDAYDDPALWAADIEAVLDAFGAEDAAVVAWSYAGLVALDYLAERGTDRVAGVDFVGAVSSIGSPEATARLGEEYVGLMGDLTATDAEASMAGVEGLVRVCRAGEPSPEELYLEMGYTAAVPPHVRDALRSRTVDREDTLAGLEVPVLFTHGSEDAVVLPETEAHHADLLPTAERSVYEGVGHSPFAEAPDRFNDELRAFLDSL